MSAFVSSFTPGRTPARTSFLSTPSPILPRPAPAPRAPRTTVLRAVHLLGTPPGDHAEYSREVAKAMQSGASNFEGARLGPPPDLPSLLLHNRIIYLGMALLPAVTELIIAEFLYLQYQSADKPIFMYINSTGTSGADGSNVGFETEAFAICDTMNYVKPPVHTICVGQAYGLAAMLLANGAKGNRAALPNTTIMLHQPRASARGPASDIAIKAKEVLFNRHQAFEIIAKATGKTIEQVEKDAMRSKYLSAYEAKEYGIIDKVLESSKNLPMKAPSFMEAL